MNNKDDAVTRRGSPPRLAGLDSLRGLAAFGVLMVHSIFILPLGEGVGTWTRYLVLGVPLFFIISAVSLSAAYQDGFSDSGAVKRYAIRRYLRIAPLFYVMLCAWLLVHYLNNGSLLSFKSILNNLLFVFSLNPNYQTSIVPAGWSIGVEMVFYVVFPFLLRWKGLFSAFSMLAVALLAAWLFNSAVHEEVKQYFFWTHPLTNAPYFCFGVVCWRLYNHFRTVPGKDWSGGFLPLSILLMVWMIIMGPAIDTGTRPVPMLLVMGWGMVFLLLVLSQMLRPMAILVNSTTSFLGKISYSLYLSHPLLIYASGLTVWAAGFAPLPWMIVPLVTMVTAGLAAFYVY
jgi:peptidoglycan/LPS O-acetylase OafA/YrhL